jgi:hypothetical protein
MNRLLNVLSRPSVAFGVLATCLILVDGPADARRRRAGCYVQCQPVQCWAAPTCCAPQGPTCCAPLSAVCGGAITAAMPTPAAPSVAAPPSPPAEPQPATPANDYLPPAKPTAPAPAAPPAEPPMPAAPKAEPPMPAAPTPVQAKPEPPKPAEPQAAAQPAGPPPGFTSLYNGQDLAGWHGMTTFDFKKLDGLSEEDRKKQRDEWNATIPEHWKAAGDVIENDGFGAYLTTDGHYRDYELLVDYKTVAKADSGIYLKGTPQVQIWDHTNADQFKNGSDKGSGGLWNNSAGAPGKDPAMLADKPFGEWNHFRIVQTGARTSVWLNEQPVVSHAIMENYFHRDQPLYPAGPVQLQTHGGPISWRNIYIREIPAAEANEILRQHSGDGFTSLFNGQNLDGWKGAVDSYEVADGAIRCKSGKGGVLHSPEMYGDFVARLEFKLPPGGNNGLAIRYPGEGDTAYVGMCELQVLDSEHEKYAKLDARQYHGSAYGMVAAHRGYLRPTGEWNFQVVTVQGSNIQVELNGSKILDTDLSKVTEYMANSPHPGKERTEGYFGLAGHSDPVEFRNIEIKRLDAK